MELPTQPQRVLRLAGASQRPRVRWQDGTIDNENMNKKKTKSEYLNKSYVPLYKLLTKQFAVFSTHREISTTKKIIITTVTLAVTVTVTAIVTVTTRIQESTRAATLGPMPMKCNRNITEMYTRIMIDTKLIVVL